MSIRIENLPFPKIGRPIKEYTLGSDMFLEQWQIPAGTRVKLMTTEDFGFCVLPEGVKDKRGFDIPRRFFRY